jgi:HK97 gp10 family phage protein
LNGRRRPRESRRRFFNPSRKAIRKYSEVKAMADEWKWFGEDLKALVKSGATKNLTAAGEFLKREMKKALNKSGRTVTITKTKSGKIRKKLGKRGSAPSKPGEPPRKQTGTLRNRVFKKLRNGGATVRVGTTAPHGGLLEFGTKNMAPRPYIRSTFAENQAEVQRILTRPIPDSK